MKRVLKWSGIILGSVAVLAVIVAGVLSLRGGARLARLYDVQVPSVVVSMDEEAIARGRHLVEAVLLCNGCHEDDFGGKVLIEEPGMAMVSASNLTSGQGGVGSTYGNEDYVRAIRHGVNAEGRGLMIMHADRYHSLGESDLAALVAYVRSVPPVDRKLPATNVPFLGRIMVALGMLDTESIPLIPAEAIDHESPLTEAPPPGVTPEHGAYLTSVAMCAMCHGEDLHGGLPIEPDAPPGPDITVYGSEVGWSAVQFVSTIRTGVTPYGKTLDATVMPAEFYAKMTDEELLAIAAYLGSAGSG